MGRKVLLVCIFFILSGVIFLNNRFFSQPLDLLTSLFSPPRAALYSFVHAEGKDSAYDKILSENKKLREGASELNFLKQDNEALRSQFQDTVIPPEKLIPVRIVGFKGGIFSPSVFILNQGDKSGIKRGMAVIVGHQLLGKIGTVAKYYSEVILVKNKEFSTLAVSDSNNTPGIIVGQEDFMVFGDVVITDTISKDETISTKGEMGATGMGIPAGLIIGKVKTINKSETKPFQSAVIESLLDFKRLTTVFVVVSK